MNNRMAPCYAIVLGLISLSIQFDISYQGLEILNTHPLSLTEQTLSFQGENVSESNETGVITPDNSSKVKSDDGAGGYAILIYIGVLLICALLVGSLVIWFFRRMEISNVDWEDDDAWLKEDWVDIDIDDSDQKVTGDKF